MVERGVRCLLYLTNLNRKLQAIRDKDVAQITADHVYIPFLGSSYSEAQLQAWLDKRITQLEDIKAKNYTDQQIATRLNTVYNSLSASDKLISDKILADEPYELNPSNADNYDKLIAIILYKFVDGSVMAVTITQTANPAGVAASSAIATYSSQSIGTASSDRIVVVLVGTEFASSNPSACTIDYGSGHDQVHDQPVQRLALALVDGDRPRQLERQLRERSDHLPAQRTADDRRARRLPRERGDLGALPVRELDGDHEPAARLVDTDHPADRAVHPAMTLIVVDHHDLRAHFEPQLVIGGRIEQRQIA